MLKRGQVTAFVILGVILVFTIFLGVLIMQNSKPITTDSKIDDALVLREIKTCLDSKLKYSILTSGKQTGLLYNFQGGENKLQGINLNYNDQYYIPYSLPYIEPRIFYESNLYFPYICPGTPKTEQRENFIGLYPFDDSNNLVLKNGCIRSNKTSIIINLADIDSEMSRRSFQTNIFHYINSTLEECYDIDSKIYPYSLQSDENAKVELIFSKNDVILKVKRALKLTKDSKLVKTITAPIEINGKIRLREHYEFLKEVMEKEISDASFNPIEHSRDGFVVNIFRNASNNDDVISIKDIQSYIDGEKFEIYVAKKNNYPIISYSPSKVFFPQLNNPDNLNPFYEPLAINLSTILVNKLISDYNDDNPANRLQGYPDDEATFSNNLEDFRKYMIYWIHNSSNLFEVFDREEDRLSVTNKTNFTSFGNLFEVNITACDEEPLCVSQRFLFNVTK